MTRLAALFATLLLLAPLSVAAQSGAAGRSISEYREASPAARDARIAEMLSELPGGTPAIDAESGEVTFFYLAETPDTSVSVRGDFTPSAPMRFDWSETGVAMMPVVPGGRLFALTRTFEADARIDYQLVVNGKAQVDPGNIRNRDGGIYGQTSELVMPGYDEPGLSVAWNAPPKGRFETVSGDVLHGPRARVYLPEGYDPARRYPVIYVPDGAAWDSYFHFGQTLDTLISAGRMAPAIAVLMDAPPDRSRFYGYGAQDYLDYVSAVVAWVDGHYPTIRDRAARAHLGTSAGGRAALHAGYALPDTFGLIGMMSPSFRAPEGVTPPDLEEPSPFPEGTRFWVSSGSYERRIDESARKAAALLTERGYDVTTHYTHEGHSLATWRNMLPDLLETFFPPD
ncbi:alpha/beta hydrolase [Stakelama tenebrarum]|uniref:Esterase n=1 Tax=Stakelama tenebrarum TaxID=2711215 RepID=A0A6G6Y8F7_9SPHN|nr:alpha/beta hydrolase-fold protein [Sphingosinithalassobacter tenebrarum]QIG81131.1 hypothetical protein G5C33_16000 [Sphingosinithalassobacter tenebrarum]